MQLKGRTLAALLIVTMVVSSLLTYMVVGSENSLLGQTVAMVLDKVGFKQASPAPTKERAEISPKDAKELQKVSEVYGLIKNNYLTKPDDGKLIDGAITGMLNALDDPYTVYMDPKSAEQFNDTISSSFQGIGAEVTMENGKVTIVSPFKGSPAESAGLRPKDQIVSVNGESLEGLDLYEAVLKIRGPKGSKAQLGVLRPGSTDKLSLTVVRDDIPIETVNASTITQDGKKFGKIEVTQFSTNTATRFREEIAKFEKEKIDGLIIDLRGNPGGLLTTVVDMAQQLVPNKGTIVQIEDPSGKREVVKSTFEGKKPYPITVLIDKGSASASEIFAGAMKENGYQLVGHLSFGKGTVQNTVELGDKSQVKMTIAKWLTPSGEWIHKKGIEPNIAIDQPKYFTASPIEMKNGPLKLDQNGEAIKNVQLILDGLGFPPGRVDGYFDEKTQTAVKAFQKLNGLQMTGEVDTQTANKLQDLLIKKIKDPANDLQMKAAIQILEKAEKK